MVQQAKTVVSLDRYPVLSKGVVTFPLAGLGLEVVVPSREGEGLVKSHKGTARRTGWVRKRGSGGYLALHPRGGAARKSRYWCFCADRDGRSRVVSYARVWLWATTSPRLTPAAFVRRVTVLHYHDIIMILS